MPFGHQEDLGASTCSLGSQLAPREQGGVLCLTEESDKRYPACCHTGLKLLDNPPTEISPGYSLEGLMLKLKLQYFGHLMQRVDSLEKTLMLGGIGRRRKRG